MKVPLIYIEGTSVGQYKKKKTLFLFVLCSLIRTFVPC
jgi:hypothetical protein